MRRICPEKVVFSFRDALENRENIKIFIVLGGFEKWSEILRRLGNIRKKNYTKSLRNEHPVFNHSCYGTLLDKLTI